MAAPVEASLAYLANPLQYPVQALRQRMQGTVLLRVLVDETGKPLEVSVTRGSGHAVRGWATVPVTFATRG